MKSYKELVSSVLKNGTLRFEPRTGINILSCFGLMLRHDMCDGFPLLTTKRMFPSSVFSELEWFISGKTDLKSLLDNGNTIWVGDAYKKYLSILSKYKDNNDPPYPKILTSAEFVEQVKAGKVDGGFDLGPIYGSQWRGTYSEMAPDQLSDVVKSLKEDEFARRHLVVSWNPSFNKYMVLPPCHTSFQFYVRYENDTKYLDLMWYQRSADLALGVPYNVASYALLLELVAKEIGALCGVLSGVFGDIHIYESHIENLKIQIERDEFSLPRIDISNTNLFNFDHKQVHIVDYNHSDKISFKLYN